MPEVEARHIVTLVSPDGRFGGPTKVALDISAEQIRRGRKSAVFAGAIGYDSLPSSSGEVPLHLAPARVLVPRLGFATTVAPGLRRKVTSKLTGDQIFHVHLARDLVTLPIAMALQKRSLPYVIQTHGMIDASSRWSARMIDMVMSSRVIRDARVALVLTPEEEAEVTRLSGGATRCIRFDNGIPEDRSGGAESRAGALFLGRLHPRKGGTTFARAAIQIANRYPAGTFRMVGPDEGDREAIREIIGSAESGPPVELADPVAPERVSSLMSSAMVFVQPAENEPFGMTVLEAMSVGTPAIVHTSSALASVIVESRAGWTFTSEAELRDLLVATLDRPQEAAAAGERARSVVRDRFSMTNVVDELDKIYRDVRP